MFCLRLISIALINHSDLSLRLIPSVVPFTRNLSSYLGDVHQAVSESLLCVPSPAPSSEKKITSCFIFMRFKDESDYPQAIQFIIERSHLPPARSYF